MQNPLHPELPRLNIDGFISVLDSFPAELIIKCFRVSVLEAEMIGDIDVSEEARQTAMDWIQDAIATYAEAIISAK